MGDVYEVRDTNLDKNLALKVLNSDINDSKVLMRFQNEARTASKLKHPNIATVYDFGLAGKTPYLAIEFVPGDSLSQILNEQEFLSRAQFFDIFMSVLNALDCAHKENIIHRDIKPGNIIVLIDSGEVRNTKLLDFGIAKALDTDNAYLTRTGELVGTPYYMSPEQADGLPLTPASDLYSLGCVMYHSLAGKPPFAKESTMETILAHRTEEAEFLSRDASGQELPEALCTLVMQLLEKSPTDRIRSAKEVKEKLASLKPLLLSEHDHEGAEESAPAATTYNTTWKPASSAELAKGDHSVRNTTRVENSKPKNWLIAASILILSTAVLAAIVTFQNAIQDQNTSNTKPSKDYGPVIRLSDFKESTYTSPERYKEGLALLDKNKFHEALAVFNDVEKASKESLRGSQAIDAAAGAATALWGLKRYDEANAKLKQCMVMASKRNDEPKLRTLASKLMALEAAAKRYKQLEDAQKDYIDSLQRTHGSLQEVASVHCQTTLLYANMAEYVRGEAESEKALGILKGAKGNKDLDIALATASMARCQKGLNEFREAKVNYEKSMKVIEQYDARAMTQPQQILVLDAYFNYASMLGAMGKFEEARAVNRKGIEVASKVPSPGYLPVLINQKKAFAK